MKLNDLVEKYIAYKILAEPSQIAYRARARNFVNTLCIDPDIAEITEDMVLLFRQAILARSTAVTYNNNRRHLSVLFRFAMKKGWVANNPFIDSPKAPEPKLRPKTVPLDNLKRAISWITTLSPTSSATPAWAKPPIFWHAFITTLYLTGMRKRQIQYLQWKDISFSKKIIHLSAANSKNRREWDIPLHPVVEMALRILKCHAEKSGVDTQSNDLVFPYQLVRPPFDWRTRDFSKPVSYELIRKFFEKISDLFHAHVRCHRIRHTTGTELMRNTKNPKLVQELLGHTTLNTTMLYVHPSMEDLRDLVNLI